jgi:hypothetical protein
MEAIEAAENPFALKSPAHSWYPDPDDWHRRNKSDPVPRWPISSDPGFLIIGDVPSNVV